MVALDQGVGSKGLRKVFDLLIVLESSQVASAATSVCVPGSSSVLYDTLSKAISP